MTIPRPQITKGERDDLVRLINDKRKCAERQAARLYSKWETNDEADIMASIAADYAKAERELMIPDKLLALLPEHARVIRESGWELDVVEVLDAAMSMTSGRIASLVTRESLESAAIKMARYIVLREGSGS